MLQPNCDVRTFVVPLLFLIRNSSGFCSEGFPTLVSRTRIIFRFLSSNQGRARALVSAPKAPTPSYCCVTTSWRKYGFSSVSEYNFWIYGLVLFFLIFIFIFIFSGILDQGSGVLVVFDETPVDKTYENTLELIHEMGKVVDALYSKAKKLQWRCHYLYHLKCLAWVFRCNNWNKPLK